MSRILVTGATGFLGSHVVANLLSHGHEVVAMSRRGGAAPRGAVVKQGDILDAAAVAEAASGCSVVLHCAGKVSRDPSDAEALDRVHRAGTMSVLAACKAAGVTRAIVASTSGTVAVSADPDHIAVETDETPIGLINKWPYYRSKLFAEQAALGASTSEFAVVSVNPSLLLGPGDREGSSTGDVRQLLEEKIPAVPPGGVAFVDARDAAEAMRLAIDKGRPGERYLVSACNVTMREFFARIARVGGVKAPLLPMPRAPEFARAGASILQRAMRKIGLELPVDPVSIELAQYYWYCDCAKAEADLGWLPRDPMTTLQDTVDDLRARGVIWPSAR